MYYDESDNEYYDHKEEESLSESENDYDDDGFVLYRSRRRTKKNRLPADTDLQSEYDSSNEYDDQNESDSDQQPAVS